MSRLLVGMQCGFFVGLCDVSLSGALVCSLWMCVCQNLCWCEHNLTQCKKEVESIDFMTGFVTSLVMVGEPKQNVNGWQCANIRFHRERRRVTFIDSIKICRERKHDRKSINRYDMTRWYDMIGMLLGRVVRFTVHIHPTLHNGCCCERGDDGDIVGKKCFLL